MFIRHLLTRASLVSLTVPPRTTNNTATTSFITRQMTADNSNNGIGNSTPITSSSDITITKRICFLRHGQALHNPRAEEARSNGCSHQRFLDLMHEDDAFDACLTPLGESQASTAGELYKEKLRGVELVVSSPLSRAIQTADLAAPVCTDTGAFANRVCVEHFREINGWLLNAKRRERVDLEKIFHKSWDFSSLSDDDETWTDALESEEACAERGYLGLLWLRDRPEDKILTVAHGVSLYNFLLFSWTAFIDS